MAICVQITKRLNNFVLQIDFASQDGCVGILGINSRMWKKYDIKVHRRNRKT